MSPDLRHAARDYLALRHALGYQLRGYDRLLDDLVADLERAGTGTLTIELAVAWATKPAAAPPFRCKARLGIARGFAGYLQTLDPATQVPPTNLLASAAPGQPHYLYSPTEIHTLAATDTLTPALRRGDLPHAAGAAGGDRGCASARRSRSTATTSICASGDW